MMRGMPLDELDGRLSSDQLSAAVALVTGRDIDQIAGFALVVVTRDGDSGNHLTVITSHGGNDKATAELLTHAARHMGGGCTRCLRTARRKAGRPW